MSDQNDLPPAPEVDRPAPPAGPNNPEPLEGEPDA
jgi:hypothetical protein